MNTLFTGQNFVLDYNQSPDMKARIINKGINEIAKDCINVSQLLEVYELEFLPEYKSVIRSSEHLFASHLPLCMLYHLLYDEEIKLAVLQDEFDDVTEFLFTLCENKYALKGASL